FLLCVALGESGEAGARTLRRSSTKDGACRGLSWMIWENREPVARDGKEQAPSRREPPTRGLGKSRVLATEAQARDQGAVTSGVLTLQVVQQLATLVDHADQTTTAVVVL